MAEAQASYVVRDAGSPSRLGKVYKTYPYTLGDLLEALDEARMRSRSSGPQLVIRINGGERKVFRRFEDGREVPVVMPGHPS